MERQPFPRDFVSTNVGIVAIRLVVDELFANSDKQLFQLFNLMLKEGDSNE